MKNSLLRMIEKRKIGIHCGIASYCSANKLVIESVLEQSLRNDDVALIEGTSNQVNQFGGYTGMTPYDFRDYVFHIADKIGYEKKNIILGGDHMGPLPWCHEPAEVAMDNAKELVRQCVLAGYKKIHLDTSMKLGDDAKDDELSVDVIAERGVILFEECEKAYQELIQNQPDAVRPVYVIGSEVPIPGGAHKKEDSIEVTNEQEFENTIYAYKKKFKEHNIANRWQDIIAVVVQPGVEFGTKGIHEYDREKAKKLTRALTRYPDIVFEGHSTDYQSASKLKEMVEDGIAIIKVGPALTLAVREGLYALEMIEKELIVDENKQSHFSEILDNTMCRKPGNWEKYYHGTEQEKRLARKYSFSDRSRYYFIEPEVDGARRKLLENMEEITIPMSLIHQYMPIQYKKIRDGRLALRPRDLVKDFVTCVIEDYNYAVKNYLDNGLV